MGTKRPDNDEQAWEQEELEMLRKYGPVAFCADHDRKRRILSDVWVRYTALMNASKVSQPNGGPGKKRSCPADRQATTARRGRLSIPMAKADKVRVSVEGLWLTAECAPDVPLGNIEALCCALEKYRGYYRSGS